MVCDPHQNCQYIVFVHFSKKPFERRKIAIFSPKKIFFRMLKNQLHKLNPQPYTQHIDACDSFCELYIVSHLSILQLK